MACPCAWSRARRLRYSDRTAAAKSTLMKTIFGLLTPKQGRVMFEDTDITGMATDRLIRMGMSYVPQTGNIFPSLSIEENLEMGAFADGSDIRSRISEMYRMFPDLERSRRQRAGNLSGGQRQMLAFGRALMLRPRLLLLDEPSAGLSPIMAQLIFDRLRDIQGTGIAILIIEHNIRTALAMSDRGYALADGENQLDGSATGDRAAVSWWTGIRCQGTGDIDEERRDSLYRDFSGVSTTLRLDGCILEEAGTNRMDKIGDRLR